MADANRTSRAPAEYATGSVIDTWLPMADANRTSRVLNR